MGRKRFWTRDRLEEAYRIYVAEKVSLEVLTRRFGMKSHSDLHRAMRREGFRMRKRGGHSWNDGAGPTPVEARSRDLIVRGAEHRCIYAEGECLGCGASRVIEGAA